MRLIPKKLRNIRGKDWMSIIGHFELYTTNSDAIREMIESPVKLFITFMLVSDWVLLRAEIDTSRIYVAVVGAVLMPCYLMMQYKIGQSRFALAYLNILARFRRGYNDIQWRRNVELTKENNEMLKDIHKIIKGGNVDEDKKEEESSGEESRQ